MAASIEESVSNSIAIDTPRHGCGLRAIEPSGERRDGTFGLLLWRWPSVTTAAAQAAECKGYHDPHAMFSMRYSLSSGDTIVDDQDSGGAIKIHAGITLATFMVAARKAHIAFQQVAPDRINLCNSFFAKTLYFRGGKLSEIEE